MTYPTAEEIIERAGEMGRESAQATNGEFVTYPAREERLIMPVAIPISHTPICSEVGCTRSAIMFARDSSGIDHALCVEHGQKQYIEATEQVQEALLIAEAVRRLPKRWELVKGADGRFSLYPKPYEWLPALIQKTLPELAAAILADERFAPVPEPLGGGE